MIRNAIKNVKTESSIQGPLVFIVSLNPFHNRDVISSEVTDRLIVFSALTLPGAQVLERTSFCFCGSFCVINDLFDSPYCLTKALMTISENIQMTLKLSTDGSDSFDTMI